MDELLLTDCLRYAHILSVAVGLGTSFMADLHVLTRLHGRVTEGLIRTLETYHKIVWVALFGMWMTGLALVYIRTGFELANFTPKLFSKLFIVSTLTLNAMVIGNLAMPALKAALGRSILQLPFATTVAVAAVSGVSTASWLLALALGVSKILAKSSWAIFLEGVPAAYLLALGLATGAMLLLQTGARAGQSFRSLPGE